MDETVQECRNTHIETIEFASTHAQGLDGDDDSERRASPIFSNPQRHNLHNRTHARTRNFTSTP